MSAVKTNADNLGYFNPPNVYKPAILDIELVGEYNPNDGAFNKYRITQNDGKIFEFEVKNGSGGSTGLGIDNVEEIVVSTESSGVNIIRITFTDGTYRDFKVRNGAKGDKGDQGIPGPAGIDSVTTEVEDPEYSADGPEVEVGQITDGVLPMTFKHIQGPQGVSIESVEQTTKSLDNGGTNVVTITLENGDSETIEIKNGESSAGFFATSALLEAAHPSPVVGDYAFVSKAGDGTFPAYIYVCSTAGTWTNSTQEFTTEVPQVTVSQNASTGHTDISVGGDTTPVASVEEVSQLGQNLNNFVKVKYYNKYLTAADVPPQIADADGYFISGPIKVRGYFRINVSTATDLSGYWTLLAKCDSTGENITESILLYPVDNQTSVFFQEETYVCICGKIGEVSVDIQRADNFLDPNSDNFVLGKTIYQKFHELKGYVDGFNIKLKNLIDDDYTKYASAASGTITDEGNGVIKLVSSQQYHTRIQVRTTQMPTLVVGHKYFVSADFNPQKESLANIYIDGWLLNSDKEIPAGTYSTIYGIITAANESISEFGFYSISNDKNTIGDYCLYKNLVFIDITESFSSVESIPTAEQTHKLIKNYPRLTEVNIKDTNFINSNILTNREFDCYIAGSNSAYKGIADIVCNGKDDQIVINEALSKYKSVYFYDDSVFNISAPLLPVSGNRLVSHGAKFLMIDMVTQSVTNVVGEGGIYFTVEDITKFVKGMYLYVTDSSGKADDDVIVQVYGGTNQIEVKYGIRSFDWQTLVVKTASPAIFCDQCDDVVIKGLHIDLNVANNPRQDKNPDFMQEGIELFESTNCVVDGCKIMNGGRRGICSYDAKDCRLLNNYIENWHEHSIDIFNTYDKNGNTTELPILNNFIIANNVCKGNRMSGIQLHRGSGCTVVGNICYDNDYWGICNQEFARHNVIDGNICHDNGLGGIEIGECRDVAITNNNVFANNEHGIQLHDFYQGASRYSKNLVVAGNNVKNNGSAGILIYGADYVIVADNILTDNNQENNVDHPFRNAQILIEGGTHYKVSNNFIRKEAGYSNRALYEYSDEDYPNGYGVINDNYATGYESGAYSINASTTISRNNDLL